MMNISKIAQAPGKALEWAVDSKPVRKTAHSLALVAGATSLHVAAGAIGGAVVRKVGWVGAGGYMPGADDPSIPGDQFSPKASAVSAAVGSPILWTLPAVLMVACAEKRWTPGVFVGVMSLFGGTGSAWLATLIGAKILAHTHAFDVGNPDHAALAALAGAGIEGAGVVAVVICAAVGAGVVSCCMDD